ncbi:receptor-like protein kinase HSL1 [Ipomoea triloba]|uniref:receptor-like protein kinase HSL1 n=1 Tax=Ipomoea triloba TaxID=35885 RepID=UPI00125E4F32|nr:receptor-like protein kinase HSL1 [Ipomoea triloba]
MLVHHPIHHAFFFFFILLLSFPNYSQSLTTHEDDERAILLILKQHWGYPFSLEQWNSTSSPCDWPGISCNSNRSVTRISHSRMYTEGSFPDSTILCQLNNLVSINFSSNSLWGTIPANLSTCSKLETLDLSTNYLKGKIPGELFSMKTLRSLNLRNNMLFGEIPTPMVAYSLESLDLSYNLLNESIPKDIGNLYNLSYLDLSMNSFSGSIPYDIGNLYNLGYLDLSINSLSGPIPNALLDLQQLSHLSLSFNKLTGEIPSQLFSMKKLRSLNLGQNMLSGEIPTPRVVYSLLEYLDLSSNHLNGSMPEDIGNLYHLSSLDLSNNSLNGSIPDNIGSLYNLGHLDLSNNSFSGPIPARLLRLHNLHYLSLASNNLSGEIPVKLDLFSLTHIDLSDNQFSGDICKTVSNIWDTPTLDTLWICLNHFSGRIPYELVKGKFPYDICFDKVNLCSCLIDKKELPICPSQWLSDIMPLHINCSSNKPSKSKKIIITCVAIAALLIIGLGILILVFRPKGERREENDGEEEQTMIPFQRLEFSEGEILGGLTDENLIGNGGSGKVYRVTTTQGQSVAVKSIRHEPRQGHRLQKQFLAEVQILGGIRHCNIVKLLCCITGNNTKLLVYEYMDKQCLYRLLHGKKKGLTVVETSAQVLHWERRLNIAIGAAQGLKYMHHDCSPPILHRDIKSSNILLDSEFNAKIADFGLAKIPASEANPETASAIVGTFGYIAPEYCSTLKVNVKSDIYSFGVVLLELATGREAVTPNEDINLAQWAYKHQREGNSVADVLDEEIKDPHYLEAATILFKLGLACTLSSPSSRPSMKYVLQILQRCNNAFERAIPNGATETQINSLACVFKLVRSCPHLKPLLHIAAVKTPGVGGGHVPPPAPIPATVPPPPSPPISVTQSTPAAIGQKSLKSVLDAIVLNWYYSELAAICLVEGGSSKGNGLGNRGRISKNRVFYCDIDFDSKSTQFNNVTLLFTLSNTVIDESSWKGRSIILLS